MVPFQVTLQQHASVEVFSQFEIHEVVVKSRDLALLRGDYAKYKSQDKKMEFVVLGSDNVFGLLKKFRKGDVVNLVTEGGIVRRLSKGINVEV